MVVKWFCHSQYEDHRAPLTMGLHRDQSKLTGWGGEFYQFGPHKWLNKSRNNQSTGFYWDQNVLSQRDWKYLQYDLFFSTHTDCFVPWCLLRNLMGSESHHNVALTLEVPWKWVPALSAESCSGCFLHGKDTWFSLTTSAERQYLWNYSWQRIKTDTIQAVYLYNKHLADFSFCA